MIRARTMLLLLPIVCTAELCAQIVINEVHPVPSAGEPEWVELHNLHNQTRILRNALISDRSSTRALPDIRLPARGYALLTRDTLALRESRAIPPEAVLVEVSLPSLNNTTDVVVLRSADSTALDSVFYNMKWGTRGISLERIDPFAAAVSPANLAASQAPDSATAGVLNSVVLLDYDARLLSVSSTGDSIRVQVRNNGRKTLADCTVRLYADPDGDGYATAADLLHEEKNIVMDSGAVYTMASYTDNPPGGYAQSIAVVDSPQDERRYNDTLRSTLFFSFPAGTVRINELMFHPPPDAADYVELWNAGPDTVDLYGWRIHDRPTSTGADTLHIRVHVLLPPQSYIALVWDSTVFERFADLRGTNRVYCGASSLNLNATDDLVVLRDPNGPVDSVLYSAAWHIMPVSSAAGLSLEKINPALPSFARDSWSTSGDAQGGTPGRRNSIAVPLPAGGSLNASPNPMSRSRHDICLIAYALPFRQARLSATVYSTDGIPLRSLAETLFTGAEGFLSWNGENDEGSPLPPGPYIVLMEAVDVATEAVTTEKLLVVIAP